MLQTNLYIQSDILNQKSKVGVGLLLHYADWKFGNEAAGWAKLQRTWRWACSLFIKKTNDFSGWEVALKGGEGLDEKVSLWNWPIKGILGLLMKSRETGSNSSKMVMLTICQRWSKHAGYEAPWKCMSKDYESTMNNWSCSFKPTTMLNVVMFPRLNHDGWSQNNLDSTPKSAKSWFSLPLLIKIYNQSESKLPRMATSCSLGCDANKCAYNMSITEVNMSAPT